MTLENHEPYEKITLSEKYPMMTYTEKVQIVATQIDILNSYDPKGKIDRMQKACDISVPEIFDEHLPNHEEIDSLISVYNKCIEKYAESKNAVYKLITNSEETKEKFNELERRLTTTSCPTL